MKLTGVQNSSSFTGKSQNANCKNTACYMKSTAKTQNCTYGQLAVENAMLKRALRDASRIIANDIYVKSK